jgi:hypothetical protein
MPPPWPEETGIWATYALHCHCGALRLNMTISPPLLESQAEGKGIYTAVVCECSHCTRQGIIACHPKASNVTFTQGLEDRGEYRSGGKKNPHWFCRKCGCVVGTDLTNVSVNVMGTEARYTVNVCMISENLKRSGDPQESYRTDVC